MEKNPLVSLEILTYNHEKFILDCLKGAVSQTYSPLEIVISDDCSKDNTFNIIKQFVANYSGRHKFVINRNKKNLGIARNLKIATDLCSGQLIVNQAGDDVSLPDRVKCIVSVWNDSNNTACGFFSNALFINAEGKIHGNYFSEDVKYVQTIEDFRATHFNFKHIFEPYVWMLGATSAFDRRIYETFPPIDSRVKQEDGVQSFRSLLLGGLYYIPKPLLKYRRHENAVSFSNNYKGRTKLLASEYFYFKNQLSDAIFLNASSDIKKKIRFYCRLAYIKRIIFGIPFVGVFFLRFLLFISKLMR